MIFSFFLPLKNPGGGSGGMGVASGDAFGNKSFLCRRIVAIKLGYII